MPHREKKGAAVVRRCGTPGSACRRERLTVVFVPGMRREISHASCLGIQVFRHLGNRAEPAGTPRSSF